MEFGRETHREREREMNARRDDVSNFTINVFPTGLLLLFWGGRDSSPDGTLKKKLAKVVANSRFLKKCGICVMFHYMFKS